MWKRGLALILLMSVLCPVSSWAMTTDLEWDPNMESDLAGYRVYGGTPCGNPQALPKLGEVGKVTTYRYVGPDEDTEFEITAYDTSGNESARSSRVCKVYTLVYYKSVRDAQGVLWGLVGDGPKYRVYRDGKDLLPDDPYNHGSDIRLVNGAVQVQGTDGDTAWYVFNGTAWELADTTPPAPPKGLRVR